MALYTHWLGKNYFNLTTQNIGENVEKEKFKKH